MERSWKYEGLVPGTLADGNIVGVESGRRGGSNPKGSHVNSDGLFFPSTYVAIERRRIYLTLMDLLYDHSRAYKNSDGDDMMVEAKSHLGRHSQRVHGNSFLTRRLHQKFSKLTLQIDTSFEHFKCARRYRVPHSIF